LLALGGGRGRSCNFDPNRNAGIGRGRSYSMPAAPMHFPGAGRNARSYACMRHTSFVLRFAQRAARKSAERSSEGGLEGIERLFAAVGLGSAVQLQPARRGMLSRDLLESPNGAQSRRRSVANGRGNGQECIIVLVHKKSIEEGDKNAPLKNLWVWSTRQQRARADPVPAYSCHTGRSSGGHDEDVVVVVVEGDIIVEVEVEGEEEEEINPRSSEEPSSFSGRGYPLSNLGQLIPGSYSFAFRHPGSMSSTGSPPFAFSRATVTPQSKSTSTCKSHETRSTGNVETTTTSSSPCGGSPTSAASPNASGRTH
jgi:hypothetical protein